MKKVFGVFAFGMLLISMGLVSAGITGDLKSGTEGIYNALIEPLLVFLVGEDASAELFLARILFLVIVFAIVWASLKNVDFFTEQKWVHWVVSIAVSLVAVRYIGGSEVIQTIILPYSVMGIAISAGLPFIISFLVIQGIKGQTVRRIAWIFFIVIFIGLWFSRYDKLGNFGYIYLVTAGLAFIMLTMDGTIQRFKSKLRLEKMRGKSNKDVVIQLKAQIADLKKAYDNGKGMKQEEYEEYREVLEKQIEHIESRK